MSLIFYKYHGLGNDYLVYDIQKNEKILSTEDVRHICHRNYGLGSDGILVGPFFKDNKIAVKILNPDGSEAEKSGNGARIFSKYLTDAQYVKTDSYTLSTLGGEIDVHFNNKAATNMTISMGKLSFKREDIGAIDVPEELVNIPLQFNNNIYQCTCVSIGNPHCIILTDKISKEKVCSIGKFSEVASYFPKRINTQIVHVLDKNNIQIEIYERGAGYTLASGSSSCSAAGAVYKLGLTDPLVHVHMPGGILTIEIDSHWNVTMTGDVVFIGKIVYQ